MYSKKDREKLKRFCFTISKLVNELCYMLQSSDLDTFSSKRKKRERKKKRRKKKRTGERHLCLMLPIDGILKRKEKRKRTCFLNLMICLVVAY